MSCLTATCANVQCINSHQRNYSWLIILTDSVDLVSNISVHNHKPELKSDHCIVSLSFATCFESFCPTQIQSHFNVSGANWQRWCNFFSRCDFSFCSVPQDINSKLYAIILEGCNCLYTNVLVTTNTNFQNGFCLLFIKLNSFRRLVSQNGNPPPLLSKLDHMELLRSLLNITYLADFDKKTHFKHWRWLNCNFCPPIVSVGMACT